ncbi:MAG: hypothetical protein VKK04_25650 [Synechococcales bacterium]|nr:hypothetical protein [Synechococcales bacterium]
MNGNSLLGSLLTGVVLVAIVFPWLGAVLEKEYVDLNGIIVELMNAANDAVRRSVDTPNPEE